MEDRDLAVFCAQTALVLKSGITLHEGIGMMREDMEKGEMKEALKVIEAELEQGKTLDLALEEEGSFPQYMVNMIKIGTKSGRLDDVMTALGEYYEREALLKKSIKSAVMYPLILSVMMLIVMLVLSVKVMPVFKQVFNNLGGDISGFAAGFMQFGIAASRSVYIIIGMVIVIALMSIMLIKTNKGRRWLSKFTGRFKIAEKIAAARFASAMSLMMASGLDTDDALKMASRVVENEKMKEKLQSCEKQISEGSSFMNAFAQAEVFSKLAVRMLSMGMKTGTMDEVMKRVADNYEEEVQETLSKTVAVIEPSMVAVLSIVIGTILISVMLPLMGIMSSIG